MAQPALARAVKTSRWPFFIFFLAVMAAVLLFFIPAYIIRPFRYQSPKALALALAIKQHAPWPAMILAAAALALGIILWKRASVGKRVLLCTGVVLAVVSAVMVRVDYFEWMFHPVTQPGFESAAASKLANDEMVMAVRLGGEARAYPIREMAYHHVFNDTVAGIPIAVTY